MQLELKHLLPYLPYELKLQCRDLIDDYQLLGIDTGFVFNPLHVVSINDKSLNSAFYMSYEDVKPILRPLSDLDKSIEHDKKNFVPFEKMNWRPEYCNIDATAKSLENQLIEFRYFEMLGSWHFDIFGLIEKGLAVSIRHNENCAAGAQKVPDKKFYYSQKSK
jgi:hypothetical protein